MQKYKSTQIYQEERMWFFAALGLLLSLFAAYMYFLSASVVHVVMRKEVSQEIVQVGSYISGLEASYIAAQHAVSEDVASQHGYVAVGEKIFIARDTDSALVLSR